MSQTVRQAVHADIPTLIRIRTDVRENRLSNPSRIGAAEYAAFMAHSPIWVFEESGAVRGFAAGDTTDGSIWALFVDPPDEGRGIGRTLLKKACETLRDAGWTTIQLSTAPNTRADRFYQQNGWTPAGWTADGEVRFEMKP